jgi:hypothetical protein
MRSLRLNSHTRVRHGGRRAGHSIAGRKARRSTEPQIHLTDDDGTGSAGTRGTRAAGDRPTNHHHTRDRRGNHARTHHISRDTGPVVRPPCAATDTLQRCVLVAVQLAISSKRKSAPASRSLLSLGTRRSLASMP